MDRETIRLIVGIIGNVISLYLYLSPTPTFINIVKHKSVQAFKPDPYLATLLNCAMWLFYGLPIVHPHSLLVVTVNSVGVVIAFTFCNIFFKYSTWICRVIFIAGMVAFTLIVEHTNDARSMVVGLLCVIVNIIMYTAPLTVMKTVIKTKSVRYMPICLSFGNLLNGSIWVVYAALEFDPFIMIPNVIGAISGIIQIALYVKYKKTTNWEDDEPPNELEMPPAPSNA
ncbi:SWEET sugar transporter [Cynara cardunculus var. scolymus]|uniref:SWEET sugar transporter n=1 Tax=Cynara cardunculus var. scolymus TaxID=59895 RepID=A0A103XY00_CYNCS|nr:SWEET sugar transporter [Cynara cardunculus var. scolymus]